MRGAVWWIFVGLVTACDPGGTADTGPDARLDAPAPIDAPRDGGPVCATACSGVEACCLVEDAPMCINVADDVHNCGGCGVDCITSRRGDSCEVSQCACGDFDIGCTGTIDECCPGEAGGRGPHCANLAQSVSDCGECNRACVAVAASECRIGECVCGDSDRACAGTEVDLCCATDDTGVAFACVDTHTDARHCGGCGVRCGSFRRCQDGVCVSTLDAGTPDAGESDAGTGADP
jgi:hypothetical protein